MLLWLFFKLIVMKQKQIIRAINMISKSGYRAVLNAIAKGNYSINNIAAKLNITYNSVRVRCENLTNLGLLENEVDNKHKYYYTNFKEIRINYPPRIKVNHSSFRNLELILDNGSKKIDYKLDLESTKRFAYLRVFDTVRQPKSSKELGKMLGIDNAASSNYLRRLMGIGLVDKHIARINRKKTPIYSTTINSFTIKYKPGKGTWIWYRPRGAEPLYSNIWYLTQGKPVRDLRKH